MKVEEQLKIVRPIVTKTDLKIKDMQENQVLMKKKEEAAAASKLRSGSEGLLKAVDTANKMMTMSSYHLQFRIHEDSERIQVKLYDNETDEVIREIPPDKMLELSARIKELIESFQKLVGVFLDEII